MIKLVNATTGEEIERPMTNQEVSALEEELAERLAKENVLAEAEATKAADKAALLTKLGISEDEAKLLLP